MSIDTQCLGLAVQQLVPGNTRQRLIFCLRLQSWPGTWVRFEALDWALFFCLSLDQFARARIWNARANLDDAWNGRIGFLGNLGHSLQLPRRNDESPKQYLARHMLLGHSAHVMASGCPWCVGTPKGPNYGNKNVLFPQFPTKYTKTHTSAISRIKGDKTQVNTWM